jgi:hypothetical protein
MCLMFKKKVRFKGTASSDYIGQDVVWLNGLWLWHETLDFKKRIVKIILEILFGILGYQANHAKHLPMLFFFVRWLMLTLADF